MQYIDILDWNWEDWGIFILLWNGNKNEILPNQTAGMGVTHSFSHPKVQLPSTKHALEGYVCQGI